jgi:hypothetical protein
MIRGGEPTIAGQNDERRWHVPCCTSLMLIIERPGNRFARFHLHGPIGAWSYAFARSSPIIQCASFGLEIGIVLSGERRIETRERGAVYYERGHISAVGIGQLYTSEYSPTVTPGREVGFLVRLDRMGGEGSPGQLLASPQGDVTDPRMVDLVEWAGRCGRPRRGHTSAKARRPDSIEIALEAD